MSARDLARGIRQPDAGAPYRVGQVTGFNFDSEPPVLLVDDDLRPMRFVGLSIDYTYFDSVIWVMHEGAPLVIGRLPHMGGDLEDWHLIGAGGEPAFQNSWVNFGGAHAVAGFYMQPDGWVRLKGLVASGTNLATIFTLPVGYRPPVNIPFTSISNDVVCTVEVDTSGTVTKTSGGTNAYVSLAGITFPSAWNRNQWVIPGMESGWNRGSISSPTAEMFIRDDGWCWLKGSASGSDGSRILSLPDRAKVLLSHILAADDEANIGHTRLDLLYKGAISHGAGTAVSAQFGGQNWFGRSGAATFIAPTFLNSWANLSATAVGAGHFLDRFDVCHVQGSVTGTNNNAIFTLPAGSRPAEQHIFFTLSQGDVVCRVDVLANGDVKRGLAVASGYLSLNGVNFRAEQ